MDDLMALLQAQKIFSSLDYKAFQKLLSKLREIKLKEDEILFYQGDPSEGLYLLIKGELTGILTTFTGETKVLSSILPGETVGELGALSEEPRTLTIKAAKDSLLVKLPTKDFVTLCHRYPGVLLEVINPVVTRAQHIITMLSSEKRKKKIVMLAANKHISFESFSKKLKKYIYTLSSVVLLSDNDPALAELEPADLIRKIEDLEKSKKRKQAVLFLIKSLNSPLAEIALKEMEVLYIVGNAQTEPKYDRLVLNVIKKFQVNLKADPQFVLLHTKKMQTRYKISAWLKEMRFSLFHHVRLGSGNDMRRLLRFVRGKAVGLVLGGGGTRGFGHLGAIKALKEAKIPIDIIGGSSVGAIVAACYATTQSYHGAYEKFLKIVLASKKSVSWRSLTWPLVSIFNAKNFTKAQREVFNTTRIEDLGLPFFCISSNLAKNMEEMHQTGLVWRKTRASASIPGLIPPMVINGELHVDGAILNNLPVDIMRHILGPRGKIIAVELGINDIDENNYKFPPIITFWQALTAKLGFKTTFFKTPPFVDTFFKALLVGSLLKSRQNGLMADVLVNLDFSQFALLNVEPDQIKAMIEMGYQETMTQLKKL